MLGLGLSVPRAVARPRAGKPSLPYDPVLIVLGDSQALGTADDAAAFTAGYVADAKVAVLGASGSFVPYAPGTMAGLYYGNNNGSPGSEAGFIAKFRAAYGNTLRIIKYGASGSFQSRTPSTGTCTGSISGNLLTVTSAAGTYPSDNTLIVGTGIPTGVYVAFRNGSTNQFYVYQTGIAANPSLSVASTTITKYNHSISWSTSEGGLFEGGSGSVTNGMRSRVPTALAAMTAGGLNPRVIAVLQLLGTNDMGYAASASAFGSAASAFIAREKAAWPLAYAKIILPRVTAEAGAGSVTIRAAQAAIADADPQVFLLDTDGFGKGADTTHFNMAGLTAIGAAAYDVWAGSSAGI
jgi:hypothetical protein